MTIHRDAIVIGGGIHGCSTALHLCLRGLLPVLIEKDHAGRHASGVNAGGVRQLARDPAEIPLSNRSMDVWEAVDDLVGDRCNFKNCGQVMLAKVETEFEACTRRVRDLRLRGFDHEELLDANALRRLVPAAPPNCPGGIVSRRDGVADPARATAAFRRRAEALGTLVREGEPARNVRHDDGLWRVDAGPDTFVAPILVNAAGAWAGRIAAALDEPVALEAVAPMLMVTAPVAPFLGPVVLLQGRKLSFKQLDSGALLIGGGYLAALDPETEQTTLDWRGLRQSAAIVCELFPSLGDATIARAWAGIEGQTSDRLPIFGPSAKHHGLYHQFGFSLHGFQLGPGAGAVMAELIATGHTNTPIDGLGIGRFAN